MMGATTTIRLYRVPFKPTHVASRLHVEEEEPSREAEILPKFRALSESGTDIAAVAHRYGELRRIALACENLGQYLGALPFETYGEILDANEPERGGAVYLTAAAAQSRLGSWKVKDWLSAQSDSKIVDYGVDELASLKDIEQEPMRVIATGIFRGLEYLHRHNLSHGLLGIEQIEIADLSTNIEMATPKNVRLLGYSIPFLFRAGNLIDKSKLAYVPPEFLLLSPSAAGNEQNSIFRPAGDIWAAGMILAELVGLFPKGDHHERIKILGEALKRSISEDSAPESYFDHLSQNTVEFRVPSVDPDLRDLIFRCLYINPKDRDSAKELLLHSFLRQELVASSDSALSSVLAVDQSYSSMQSPMASFFQFNSATQPSLSAKESLEQRYELGNDSFVDYEDVSIIKELEQLTSEDVADALSPMNRPRTLSTSSTRSNTSGGGGGKGDEADHEQPESPGRTDSLNTTATMIAAMLLSRRTAQAGPASSTSTKQQPAHEPKLHDEEPDQPLYQLVSRLQDAARTQYVGRIRNAGMAEEDDLSELIPKLLFHSGGSRKRNICPSISLRSMLWISLLNIPIEVGKMGKWDDPFAGGAIQLLAPELEKFRVLANSLHMEHDVDRQLEQDVPRCHQYHLLIRSEVSRTSLYRILKLWAIKNTDSVYWQGLDSVAASVLALYPGNESVAFMVFDELVKKFMPGMFSRKENANSRLLHSRLETFNQLLAFHDPQLHSHLARLGVKPDLYAIPWLLTMFAHVLPIEEVWKVWDYLLIENEQKRGRSLILFSVAVMVQVRPVLLRLQEFGMCVAFLTRLPVDLEKLVQCSLRLAAMADCLTPAFVHLSWASRREDKLEDLARISYLCPIITAEQFLQHRRFAIFVVHREIGAGAFESPIPESVVPAVIITDEKDGHWERKLNKIHRVQELQPSEVRWLVVFAWAEKDLLQSLIEELVVTANVPFCCLLEQGGISKLRQGDLQNS